MRAIIFLIRRILIFLTDAAIWPFRMLLELWHDPHRGRALIFGLPAVLVALSSVTAVVIASTATKRSFIKQYERAKKEAVDTSQWSQAITYSRKLVELQPNSSDAKLELARMLIQDTDEETQESNKQLAQSIFNSLAPNDRAGHPDAHVRKAQYLMTAPSRFSTGQRLELAEKQLNFALSSDPNHRDSKTLLAEVYIIRRDYDRALEIYRQLFKDYTGYVFKIVEVMRMQGEADKAANVVREAVNRYQQELIESPGDLTYIRRLANCYSLLEQFDNSVAVLEDAMANIDDPKKTRALQNILSNVYIANARMYAADVDDDAEARRNYLDLLTKSYRAFPENHHSQNELTVFSLSDFPESDEARQVYDGRIDPDGASDGVLQQLGTHEIVRGDVKLGISLLEKGLEKNPKNHGIMNNLAYALIDSDLPRARELADLAVRLNPTQPNYRDTRGNILMRQELYGKAINEFERAMLSPTMKNNISVYESLVKCYEARGMFEDAASFQRKVDELKRQKELQSSSNDSPFRK